MIKYLLFNLFVISYLFQQTSLSQNTPNKSVPGQHSVHKVLMLENTGKKIENIIEINVNKKDLQAFGKQEKDYLTNPSLTLNKTVLVTKSITIRGSSSADFKRKSFSIKLHEKCNLYKNNKKTRLKSFNLISLCMDKNYARNHIAFSLLDNLSLFDLYYSYTELKINGKSEGIYLLVEKPHKYALKRQKSPLVIRRTYNSKIDKIYTNDEVDSLKANVLKAKFLSIYEKTEKLDGQKFIWEISKILDLQQYMQWMAFNHLICNGDYSDEVFFYAKEEGKTTKFKIIPWDYDDIFLEEPHEGKWQKYLTIGNKMVFSIEDALDRKIANDEVCYTMYLKTLKKLLIELDEQKIKVAFEDTYQRLYPFYSEKEILKNAKYDKYGKTDLQNLKADLQNKYNKIIERRAELLHKLD